MQTGLYKIEFNDGRIFNVYCANYAQVERFNKLLIGLKNVKEVSIISKGIHNIKQFEQISKTL